MQNTKKPALKYVLGNLVCGLILLGLPVVCLWLVDPCAAAMPTDPAMSPKAIVILGSIELTIIYGLFLMRPKEFFAPVFEWLSN